MLAAAVIMDSFEWCEFPKFKCAPGLNTFRLPGNAATIAALVQEIRLRCETRLRFRQDHAYAPELTFARAAVPPDCEAAFNPRFTPHLYWAEFSLLEWPYLKDNGESLFEAIVGKSIYSDAICGAFPSMGWRISFWTVEDRTTGDTGIPFPGPTAGRAVRG